MAAPLPESDLTGDHEVDDQPSGDDLADVHERALAAFDALAVPQIEMRANSLQARRFRSIKGAQWEDTIWAEAFENAPRPEVNKINKSLAKIDNDYRQNRMMVDFRPADDKADEDTADFLDGVYRADFYNCKGQLAHDNAWREGLGGGFGAWRLTTDYADPYDPDVDHQRLMPAVPILDADQRAYLDGMLQDGSDSRRGWVLHADPRAEAIRKWGVENIDDWPQTRIRWQWEWYRPDLVLWAEYYERVDRDERILIFTNSLTDEEQRYFESELQPGQQAELKKQGWKVRSRMFKRCRVHKYILNGSKVLKDCGEIAGDRIPIVPFYTNFEYIDGMVRWRGYVEPRMDEQRIYNAQLSRLVEISGSSAGDTPMVDPARIPPGAAQDAWANRGIGRPAYLPLLPQLGPDGMVLKTDVDMLPAPQAPPTTVALLQITGQGLEEQDDQTDQVKANVSADAMELAQNRVDERSGPYLDDFRIAVQCEGEIAIPIYREILVEEGRKVETQDADGNSQMATLMEGVVGTDKVFKIRNDITKGRYNVVASVQESTATKRDKTVRQTLNLATIAIQAQDMKLASAALLTAVEQMDGEGMEKLRDFAHTEAVSIGLDKPTEEEQAEIQQAQQSQQPDPAAQALLGQAAKLNADAKASETKALVNIADAHLKQAQAEELSKAPAVPTGLTTPDSPADMLDKVAGAHLKTAQAEHLQEQMHDKRIRRGHEINMDHAGHELAVRQQDHAESQPAKGVG